MSRGNDTTSDRDRGWFRSGDTVGRVEVALVGTDERKELVYSEVDGEAIFEGDIRLGPADLLRRAAEGAELIPMGIARKGDRYRWPGGVVPFQIAPGFHDPDRVREAVQHWRDRTRLTFIERTGSNASRHPDYLSFEDRGGCWSSVGRQGGRQVVSVGPGCPVGSVIHEIGHAVGLWHEQSRSDRDKHVEVRLENIDPSHLHNFDQHIQDGTDLGRYDYGSIMHYPSHAFSRNGKPTIVPREGQPIGQREKLSEGDLAAVGEIYAELYA